MEISSTDFAEAIGSIDVALTVCDTDMKLLYMNEKAALNFSGKDGPPSLGSSLLACHKPQSVVTMKAMLASGEPNVYTILKGGQKKLIWQAPWMKGGTIAGLVEISIQLPVSIPHYDRG
jgi:hypothetical protein